MGESELKSFDLEGGVETVQSALVIAIVVTDFDVPVVARLANDASDSLCDSQFGENLEQCLFVSFE